MAVALVLVAALVTLAASCFAGVEGVGAAMLFLNLAGTALVACAVVPPDPTGQGNILKGLKRFCWYFKVPDLGTPVAVVAGYLWVGLLMLSVSFVLSAIAGPLGWAD